MFGYEALVAAVYDFLHGCVVVRTLDGADMVFAVIFFRWFGASEDNTSGDGILACYIGVIKTFDMNGKMGQMELFLEGAEQVGGALLGIELFFLAGFVEFILADVSF